MRIFFVLNMNAGARMLRRNIDHYLRHVETLGAVPAEQKDFPAENVRYHAIFPKLDAAVEDAARAESLTVLACSDEAASRRFCRQIAERYGAAAIVAACGGDGTLNAVATALAGSPCRVMVLPFGSGNDFAKTLYPKGRRKVADILGAMGFDGKEKAGVFERLHGKVRELAVDLVACETAEGRPFSFINTVSIGVDSRVAEFASRIVRRFPRLHKASYILAVIPGMFTKFKLRMELNLRGLAWPDPCGPKPSLEAVREGEHKGSYVYTMSALANAAYYGGGFLPNPFFKLDDGVIEFALTKGIGRLAVLRYLRCYQRGEAQKKGLFRMFSAVSGEIRSMDAKRPLCITYDGELIHSSAIRFKVRQRAIRILIPASFPEPSGFERL